MPPSIATPLSSGTARDLYGVRALPPAGVVPFGYTGHAEDPTGLTWGRARCYAPRTGGWTGEDPVFTEPRYAYVSGKPAMAFDPTGRSESADVSIFGQRVACATARAVSNMAVGAFVASGILAAFLTTVDAHLLALGPSAISVLTAVLHNEAAIALSAC